MTVPIEVLLAAIAGIGTLSLLIINSMNKRIEKLESDVAGVRNNYVTRLDGIKESVAELRELVITGFGKVDTSIKLHEQTIKQLQGEEGRN